MSILDLTILNESVSSFSYNLMYLYVSIVYSVYIELCGSSYETFDIQQEGCIWLWV